jgi:hypothetical protein
VGIAHRNPLCFGGQCPPYLLLRELNLACGGWINLGIGSSLEDFAADDLGDCVDFAASAAHICCGLDRAAPDSGSWKRCGHIGLFR